MLGGILQSIKGAGAAVKLNGSAISSRVMSRRMGRRPRWSGSCRRIFGKRMLKNQMLKSTAISDAGITKQTLYEVEKSAIHPGDI